MNNKVNKLILFDWGGIVESHQTGYSNKEAWDDLFYACGYRGNKHVYYYLHDYDLSKITNNEDLEKAFYIISKDYNLDVSYEKFLELFSEIFDDIEYYKDVSDYELSLKDKCYIGVLSDCAIPERERLEKQLKLDQYDYVFLSFETGMKKPDLETFKYVQTQVPFKPEDILFLDDRADNVESAKKAGWNAYQVSGVNLGEIKDICEEFLNKKK